MVPTQVFLPGESHRQRIPAGSRSMGSWRVRHNWATFRCHHSLLCPLVSAAFIFCSLLRFAVHLPLALPWPRYPFPVAGLIILMPPTILCVILHIQEQLSLSKMILPIYIIVSILERWQFFIPLPFVYSYSFSMGWHSPPLPYLIHFWLIQNQLKLPLPLWSSSCPPEPHQ